MLNYSPSSLSTRVMMMHRFNDVDIYIEDKTNHNMHKKILNASLPEGLKFSSVFSCGNRNAVIAEANKHVNNRERLKIFVCDGDLYLQCGEKQEIPKNVLVLNRYCAENFVVNLDSALKIAFECEPEKTFEELKNYIKIEDWYDRQIKILSELFFWYAVSFDMNLDVKTCVVNVLAFFDSHTGEIDQEKINIKIDSIKNCIELEHDKKEKLQKTIEKINKNRETNNNKSWLISGKTYLIPMLARFLKVKTNFQDERGFLMRLCNKYEPEGKDFLMLWLNNFITSFHADKLVTLTG